MSNIKTVPTILMVVASERSPNTEAAALWRELDWILALSIEGPELLDAAPAHLREMGRDALEERRQEIHNRFDELADIRQHGLPVRTFSLLSLDEALGEHDNPVGFYANGTFTLESGAPHPSSEQLSELALSALRELLSV